MVGQAVLAVAVLLTLVALGAGPPASSQEPPSGAAAASAWEKLRQVRAGPWHCPSLPADSGLEWVRHDGPDFIVCYAMEAGGKEQAFGIYVGNHPSFDPGKSTVAMAGSVGGRNVVWYRGPDDADKKLSLQTVTTGFERRPYATKAHVWTGADDEPALSRRLEILQRLDFSD